VTVASLRGVRCRSCGFEGPPPDEVRERLHVAQRKLTQLDVRRRQLDAHARAAIGRALGVRWGVIAALVVGGLPFVALGAVGMLFMSVPMLVYGAVGAYLHSVAGSARRDLLAACAAVPPVHPGEAAACAFCGAPLLPSGVDPVVRCQHCGADNVVHPSAMAQASARRSIDLDTLTATLARRAEAILATARRVTLATVASVVGTPVLAFVSVLGLLLTAARLERVVKIAPSELRRYAWVDTAKGRCVGLIVRDGRRTQAYFGDNDRLPNPFTLPEGSADLPRFSATALVGERVRTASGAVGTVRGVFGAPVTNRESLVLDTGDQGHVPGACAGTR
jgi:DNA-directed RNA polymerase subunit RPC12/RpoP